LTIRSLRELGKTIFLTTHYMDGLQQLADRIAVMRGGEIIASGRPDELGGRDLRPAEIRFTLPAGLSLSDVPDLPARAISIESEHVLVLTVEPVRAANVLTGWAIERGIDIGHFSVTQPTLEDIYLELTGSGVENHEVEEVVR
jgi:ABC-2 type transport system ATP-binding protein